MKGGPRAYWCAYVVLVVVIFRANPSFSLITTLFRGIDDCYFINVNEWEENVDGTFEVVGPGEVHAEIFDPSGQLLFRDDGRKSEWLLEAEENGVYSLCLSAVESRSNGVTVVFSFRAEDTDLDGPLTLDNAAKEVQVTLLQKLLFDLSENLELLQDHQKTVLAKERLNRAVVDSTNESVLWATLAEAAALLVVGAWQIFYLRRVFEVKRYI